MKRSLARNGGLNATYRSHTLLLSGLLFCGCCEGSYARRGQDRYACTNHVLGNDFDNARTVGRKALEARVLDDLGERMMTPEMAEAAMRAYTQETNRLNRERRNSADATRKELAETAKVIAEIVRVIERAAGIAPCPTACRMPRRTFPTSTLTSRKPTGAGSSV